MNWHLQKNSLFRLKMKEFFPIFHFFNRQTDRQTDIHTYIPTLGGLWGLGPELTLQGPTEIHMLLGHSWVCLYTIY